MELTADTAKGYVPAVGNRPVPSTACQGRRSGQALGRSSTQFSACRRSAPASGAVDKLSLTIETDGTENIEEMAKKLEQELLG